MNHSERLLRIPRPNEEERLISKLACIAPPILNQLPKELKCQLPTTSISLSYANSIYHGLRSLLRQSPTVNPCPICVFDCNSFVDLYFGFCKKVVYCKRRKLKSWFCPICLFHIERAGTNTLSFLTEGNNLSFDSVDEALQLYKSFEQIFIAKQRSILTFWVNVACKSVESHILRVYCKKVPGK